MKLTNHTRKLLRETYSKQGALCGFHIARTDSPAQEAAHGVAIFHKVLTIKFWVSAHQYRQQPAHESMKLHRAYAHFFSWPLFLCDQPVNCFESTTIKLQDALKRVSTAKSKEKTMSCGLTFSKRWNTQGFYLKVCQLALGSRQQTKMWIYEYAWQDSWCFVKTSLTTASKHEEQMVTLLLDDQVI